MHHYFSRFTLVSICLYLIQGIAGLVLIHSEAYTPKEQHKAHLAKLLNQNQTNPKASQH
jgi:hypothetical protein